MRHIAQPLFVDVKRKALSPTFIYVRFSDKDQADSFLARVKELDKSASSIHMLLGEKITFAQILAEKDHNVYL